MKQNIALSSVRLALSVLLVLSAALFTGCGTDTAAPCPPPSCPTCPAPEQPQLQLELTSWFEPDHFVIQGTTYLGESSADMLTLPAKFESLLGQKNQPSYIVKLLESEIRNEQTLQADWAANSGALNVDYTPTPPAAGDVVLTIQTTPAVETQTGYSTYANIETTKVVWQSFKQTQGATRILDKIKVVLSTPNAYGSVVDCEIWSAGKAAKLSSTQIETISYASGIAWHTIYFSTDNLPILNNTEYWIRLSMPSGVPYTTRLHYNPVTASYANGQLDYDSSGSWSYNIGDAAFEVSFLPAYLSPGYIQTKVMDLGSTPTVDGLWKFQNLVPAGTSVAYEAWALDDAPGTAWTNVQRLGTETYVFSLANLGGGIVIAGTGNIGGKIYRSTDSGASWNLIQQLGTETIVFSLTNLGGGIVIAGTYPTGQIYRSTDSGASWNLIQQLGTETRVFSLSNLGGGIVVAGTGAGGKIYRSTDSGASWNLIQQLGTESYVLSLANLGGGIVVAGTYPTGQIYRSTDSGASWNLIQQLGTETYTYSLANLGGGIVVAGTGAGGKIYRSTDSGASWNLIQQLGTESYVFSLANLGGGIVVAGTGTGGKIYRSTDSGASWILIQQLGTESDVRALTVVDGLKALAGTATTGQIYYSGNPVSLGTVTDGQAITVRSQYYAVKATLTADTAQAQTPTLRSIMARFPTYRGYSDNPGLGYEVAIQSVSALSTKISDTEASSISQVTVNLAFTKTVSDYLKNYYPKNKEVRLFAGFISPGFVEADYYEYYRGMIDDWPIEEKDTVSLKVKDFSRLWDVPVPAKWQVAGAPPTGDDKIWTAMHPVDVMLDIFQGYIGSTDAELDQNSFAEVKADLPGWVVTRTITGNTIAAKDLLEELRKLMSCYFIPQPNGNIKLKRFDASAAADGALTDTDFLTKKWESNAASLINQLNIYFGHAEDTAYPVTAELGSDDFANFHAWDLSEDTTSKANWQETVTEEIKDKWTRIAQTTQVATRRGILLTRYANPPEKMTVTVDMRHMKFETGDIVAVTTLRAPSTDMSGIAAKPFQITQKTPDFTKDRLTLVLLRQGAA